MVAIRKKLMDRGDELNLDVITTFEKYEQFVEELNKELSSFKNEHSILEKNLQEVLQENNRIRQDYKDLLKISNKPEDEIQFYEQYVSNLKKQLEATINEKDCTMQLWQNAMQTIDGLEEEMKIYRMGQEGLVSRREIAKIKNHYKELIENLEKKLAASESKLIQISTQTAIELERKTDNADKTLESQQNIMKIVKNLEDEVLSLQTRLTQSTNQTKSLEIALIGKEKLINDIKTQNSQYRLKVEEALFVIEAAFKEKDAALQKEQETKEELEKIKQDMLDLPIVYEEQRKTEIDKVNEDNTNKIKDLENKFKHAQHHLTLNNHELALSRNKCQLLEAEIKRLQSDNPNDHTTKLLALEKNFETTFQKLLVSEKKNIQLNGQMECLKDDLNQMANHYEQILKSKEVEKCALQTKLQQIQTQLDTKILSLQSSQEEIKEIQQNLKDLTKKYNDQLDKNESTKSCFKQQIHDLKVKFDGDLTLYKDQLDSQVSLNNKWRMETKNITDNFEKLINKYRNDISQLRKQNSQLIFSVRQAEGKNSEYRISLQLLSKDVNKLAGLNDKSDIT